MKNNIAYYTHAADADSHWKFVALRRRFGWAGEGKFWALNNRIARSDHCRMNMNEYEHIEAIAAALDFDPDEFTEYVDYLKKIRLITEIDGHLTTEIVQECYAEVMVRREYQRDRAKAAANKSIVENAKSMIENPLSTQKKPKSIVEKEQSKVNKRKYKEKEIITTNVVIKEKEKNETTTRFKKPTIEEIANYLKEKNVTGFTAEKFHDYYESKGWRVGTSPMKNWRAAIATWAHNRNDTNQKKPTVYDTNDTEW